MTETTGSTGTQALVDRHRLADVPLASPSAHQGLLEVFRRRYVLRLLVKREVQGRYEGSFLGFLWSYINPLSQFFIYWFFMGKILGASHGFENYPVHMFAGLIIVHFFTETFGAGTRSLVGNKGLIAKMSVPREMFPVATMLVSLWHVAPQILILIGVGIMEGWQPDMVGMMCAVVAVLIAMILGTALALLFSTANVFFRDFGSFVGIINNYVRFAVPMLYPFSLVRDNLPTWVTHLYLCDPVAIACLLFQRAFWVGTTADPTRSAAETLPDHLGLWTLGNLIAAVLILVVAQRVFQKFENKVPERL
ncbi:ABC-2 type transport system permease protein [Nocardioides terrae]|uniref:ABC-2 type transport system permease protein n=1 Tax=Nocardioides terrae TaxID=574651 RepID=A0A1I1DL81_9ACTN|nr:ABC transporter permease [Nocardioides terrae]SFB75617.1 ABC-2 type transport system permease protein [Nocardioides terrae]